MTIDFKVFQQELVRYTTEPSTYDEKFSQYIERIRSSSMTSQQIAELRDSIETNAIAPVGIKLRNLVRGQLQLIYDEKYRKEIHDNKPWVTRFVEDYPISKILIWLVSVIVAGIIGFYLNELLH